MGIDTYDSLISDSLLQSAADGDVAKMAYIYAASYGNCEILRQLIANGIDVDTRDNAIGMSALMIASSAGQYDAVKLLLNHRADINAVDGLGNTAFFYASRMGHIRVVKLLIEKGMDVNIKQTIFGMSALTLTAVSNDTEIAKLLIEHGADVNASDNNGVSALIQAVVSGGYEMAKLLVQNGANVNAENKSGWTVLRLAVENGDEKIIELLENAGAKM